MDEEMEEVKGNEFLNSDIDFDYEFDADKFFDLSRPESDSEAQEAERWFYSAISYPPSPFIVKLNWGKGIPVQIYTTSSQNLEAGENVNSTCNSADADIKLEVSSPEVKKEGLKHRNYNAQDILKAKTESMVKSFKARNSTLMKPTASHLAKQNEARDLLSWCRGRLQKPSAEVDEQNPLGCECLATKRQKLEIGYLRKVAQLKHHTSFLHKIAKKVGQLEANSICSRSKVTVPKEPGLETAQRAQMRSFRSKNKSEVRQPAKSNVHTFKARPLNRKILQAPSLPPPRRRTPQLPEFHVFHLKTTERAKQHLSINVLNARNPSSAIQREGTAFRRPTSEDAPGQKFGRLNKLKACAPVKIFPSKGGCDFIENVEEGAILRTLPTDKSLSKNPPTELFKKLSLKTESENKTIFQSKQHRSSKGSKENRPSTFQHDLWRSVGKPNQWWE